MPPVALDMTGEVVLNDREKPMNEFNPLSELTLFSYLLFLTLSTNIMITTPDDSELLRQFGNTVLENMATFSTLTMLHGA